MKSSIKKPILALLLCIIVKFSLAQNDSVPQKNLRRIYKNHVGVSLGGPSFFSANYERFFSHNFSVEFGAGSLVAISGAHIASRYYFGNADKPTKISPYLGVAFGAVLITDGFSGYGTGLAYIPVGVQFLNKSGFAFSVEAAYMNLEGESFPMGALRIYTDIKYKKPKQNKEAKALRLPSWKTAYSYSPYSIGLNLFSLIRPTYFYELFRNSYFSSNLNVDLFVQRELNKNFALRVPFRVGFPLPEKVVTYNTDNYFHFTRKTIIGEIGIEPLYYLNGLNKITLLVAPTLGVGRGLKMAEELLGQSYPQPYKYVPVGEYVYYKIGLLLGAQFNLTKSVQFGLELGLFRSNHEWDEFYPQYYDWGNSTKFFLTYRFGGKRKNH